MRRRTRLAAVAVVGALAVPVLSACATTPGAAALVGGTRISVATLQGNVRAALVNPTAKQQYGANRAQFTREVLAKAISDQLVDDVASQRHLSLSRAQLQSATASYASQAGGYSALVKEAEQGGVPAAELPGYIRTATLETMISSSLAASAPVSTAALQAEYQKDIAQFRTAQASHILVKSKSLAESLLRQVKKNPSSFASLAKRYSIDTGSAAKGGSLGTLGYGQTVPAFNQALFNDPVGSYDLVHSQFGYHVLHIISRTTVPFSQAIPKLKQELSSGQTTSLLESALRAEATKVGVHVSPRYGTWDDSSLQVQAAPDPTSSSS